jgi:hypothetical protein
MEGEGASRRVAERTPPPRRKFNLDYGYACNAPAHCIRGVSRAYRVNHGLPQNTFRCSAYDRRWCETLRIYKERRE